MTPGVGEEPVACCRRRFDGGSWRPSPAAIWLRVAGPIPNTIGALRRFSFAPDLTFTAPHSVDVPRAIHAESAGVGLTSVRNWDSIVCYITKGSIGPCFTIAGEIRGRRWKAQ